MSDCCNGPKCEVVAPKAHSETSCPRCGAVGRVVGDKTVQAILKPGLAISLLAVERRFCRTPGCDVLYYGADGRLVEKSAARVRVGVKAGAGPIPICYCFGFDLADVRRELAETGACAVPARIADEIRAGHCACEVKNPSGLCCLGEVNKALKDALVALGKGLQLRSVPARIGVGVATTTIKFNEP